VFCHLNDVTLLFYKCTQYVVTKITQIYNTIDPDVYMNFLQTWAKECSKVGWFCVPLQFGVIRTLNAINWRETDQIAVVEFSLWSMYW